MLIKSIFSLSKRTEVDVSIHLLKLRLRNQPTSTMRWVRSNGMLMALDKHLLIRVNVDGIQEQIRQKRKVDAAVSNTIVPTPVV
jgi:hypothetical protein